jgi:hypothetical protein
MQDEHIPDDPKADAIGTSRTTWFSDDVQYEGKATATFSNPEGVVKGAGHVMRNQDGEFLIEFQVEDTHIESADGKSAIVSSSASLQFGYILSGERPKTSNGASIYSVGGSPAIRYADVTIETSDGVFYAPSARYAGETSSFAMGVLDGGELTVRFKVTDGRFDANSVEGAGAGPITYWVLPLENLLTDFRTNCPDLQTHPLRIAPSPLIPDDLPTREQFLAQALGYGDYKLICFEFNGASGFIEAVIDYADREAKLKKGQARNLITAVMVGEVGPHGPDNLREWFPADYVRLLGLATGQEVGAGWIEFRDAAGNLVTRIHKKFGYPTYVKGVTLIHEEVTKDPSQEGIGYLLTKAGHCSEFGPGTSRLSVMIRQLLRAGLSSWTVEERLTLLARIVEGLSKHFIISHKDLLQELDASQQAQVVALRDALVADIRKMAAVAKSAGNTRQHQALVDIANGVKRSTGLDEKYGRSIVRLLTHFGLNDATVMEHYYAQNPRPDGKKSWEKVLSHYRNTPIHEGYFDTIAGAHDIKDAIKVMRHLHDVLARMIFKMLGYDGGYQPVVKSGPANYSLDWVTINTTGKDLGY